MAQWMNNSTFLTWTKCFTNNRLSDKVWVEDNMHVLDQPTFYNLAVIAVQGSAHICTLNLCSPYMINDSRSEMLAITLCLLFDKPHMTNICLHVYGL